MDGADRRRELDPDRLAEGGGGACQPCRLHRFALRRGKVGEIRGCHGHGVPVVVRQLQREGLPEVPLGLGAVIAPERQPAQPLQRQCLAILEPGPPAQLQRLRRQRPRPIRIALKHRRISKIPQRHARPARRI